MSDKLTPYRPLVVAGVLLVLVGILGYARSILIPIAVGILLSFILTPVVAWMQARGLRRGYAVVFVVVTTLVLVVTLMGALTTQLRDLASDLPDHKAQITRKIRDLTGGRGPGIISRLSTMIEEISDEFQGEKDKTEKAMPVRIQAERGSAFTLVPVLAAPVWALLGKIGLVLALTTSMLLTREDLRNRILTLVGEGNLTSSTRAMDDASRRISRFLTTQVILNASFGTLFGVGLWLMGVKYALVWGVLAAMLRFIPYIGTWLAAVFPVLVSLAVEGWGQPLLVVGWCVVLGLATNNVLEPLLVSRSTGVSPIALVVSAAFWTWLWGPIGLVLATPMTVCLSVLGKYVPSLGFLDILLGSSTPLDPVLKLYQRLLARDEAEASDLLEEYLTQHPTEELFDGVIIPALSRAQADHERGHLSEDELDALVKTTRDLLAAILGDNDSGETAGPLVLACPGHDEADRLALELLSRMLGSKARMQILSADLTASEVVELAMQEQPALVCIGLLPPVGESRARYLSKRLRARDPKMPIVAGVWGVDDPGALAQQLKAAGATEVTGNLVATRAAIVPLAQVASRLAPVV